MKQKGFLIMLLALAVVISLSAGSVAIYASAADVAASQGDPQRFDLASPVAVDVRPTVAPMQTASYPFEVSGDSLGGGPADAMDMTVFFGSTDALAQTPEMLPVLKKAGVISVTTTQSVYRAASATRRTACSRR